jgi:hypothetical protein
MIFPQDSEIREYATYYIRALSIFKEEFKNSQGRPPNEFEVQDFSKMGIIPYGILKQQNGFQKSMQDQSQSNSNPAKNENKPSSSEQPKNQPAQQQKVVEPKTGWKSEILRLLNEFPQNLERKSQSKVKIVKDIPRSEWNNVKEGFEKEGWKYDWKEKAFMISEEMKA